MNVDAIRASMQDALREMANMPTAMPSSAAWMTVPAPIVVPGDDPVTTPGTWEYEQRYLTNSGWPGSDIQRARMEWDYCHENQLEYERRSRSDLRRRWNPPPTHTNPRATPSNTRVGGIGRVVIEIDLAKYAEMFPERSEIPETREVLSLLTHLINTIERRGILPDGRWGGSHSIAGEENIVYWTVFPK